MGFFDRFTGRSTDKEEVKSGITSPEPWLFDLFTGGVSSSGPVVSAATALRVPAVKAPWS
jgi:hypothetical protein